MLIISGRRLHTCTRTHTYLHQTTWSENCGCGCGLVWNSTCKLFGMSLYATQGDRGGVLGSAFGPAAAVARSHKIAPVIFNWLVGWLLTKFSQKPLYWILSLFAQILSTIMPRNAHGGFSEKKFGSFKNGKNVPKMMVFHCLSSKPIFKPMKTVFPKRF